MKRAPSAACHSCMGVRARETAVGVMRTYLGIRLALQALAFWVIEWQRADHGGDVMAIMVNQEMVAWFASGGRYPGQTEQLPQGWAVANAGNPAHGHTSFHDLATFLRHAFTVKHPKPDQPGAWLHLLKAK